MAKVVDLGGPNFLGGTLKPWRTACDSKIPKPNLKYNSWINTWFEKNYYISSLVSRKRIDPKQAGERQHQH